MKGSSRTQGATLIASLLLVVMLLAAIMAVTAQITLSARRSSSDQEQTLRAGFAAESGVARVQARLRLMEDLLHEPKIPFSNLNDGIEAEVAALCGLPGLPPYTSGVQELCTFDDRRGLRTGSAARVRLFLAAVGPEAFARQGLKGTTEAGRAAFWADLFSGKEGIPYTGGSEGTRYSAQFGLRPTRVTREQRPGELSPVYRLFFQVPPLGVTGTAGSAARRLEARAGRTEYHLLISRPPFSRYALFTNHHFHSLQAELDRDRITFTDRTLFSGPVHSNQQFLFQGRPWFGGEVTNAGCPVGGINAADDGCAATPQPGAWFGGEPRFVGEVEMSPTPGAPAWCPGDPCTEGSAVKPEFPGGVKWASPYIALPPNANDQAKAAQEGGLFFDGSVNELQLRRDEIEGQEVQRVTYSQGGQTVELAYKKNRELLIRDGNQWKPAQRQVQDENGAWRPFDPEKKPPEIGVFRPHLNPGAAGESFNGVIHVSGAVENLNAGAGNTTTSGPDGAAVASFAGLTVSATGDVNVTSNLRYAELPCSGSHVRGADGSVTPAKCENTGARNMLGLFSSGGDINLVSPESCEGAAGGCPSLRADPVIHAVMMASRGAVQVRGYDRGPANNSLGSVNLIGGLIENYYGAFGITDGRGFGRNFVYDPRMNEGMAPPAFPTQREWTIGIRTMVTVDGEGRDRKLVNPLRLSGDAVSTAAGGTQ